MQTHVEFPGRFSVWMPENGKKADLMFVQHMVAVLKSDRPHGDRHAARRAVPRRRGKGKRASYFIEQGWLEAVIGLPAEPVLRHRHSRLHPRDEQGGRRGPQGHRCSSTRTANIAKARRRTSCAPRTSAKIVHAYRSAADAARLCACRPIEEIEAEDYNCNIRRYVDNAPPPEPHDVRAHLHGGVPKSEIAALESFWANYAGLREACFLPRGADPAYCDLAPAIASRRDIAAMVRGHAGVLAAHEAFMWRLEAWWRLNLPAVAQLAPAQGHGGNVYALRRALVANISAAFADQTLLNAFQIRGAMARYVDGLKADLKSVAASGWGAELIPADELLQSQFPELVEELANKRARLEELQALFAAADDEDFEDDEDSGVIAGSEVKRLKEEAKALGAKLKAMTKAAKAAAADLAVALSGRLHASVVRGGLKLGGTLTDPDFDGAKRIVGIAVKAGAEELFIAPVRILAEEGPATVGLMTAIATRLERHKALEDEAKALKADLRAAEKKQETLVEAARAKITPDRARNVILERFHRTLVDTYRAYLDSDRRVFTAAIENLHEKYAVTVREIEKARDDAAGELGVYLKALNYV